MNTYAYTQRLELQRGIMTTIKAFIKRHPVLTYFALTFAISWGGILILVGPSGIPGTEEQVETLFPFVLLAWFAGPSVASILLTGLAYGRAGLRELLSRLLRWRVDARWYAVALLPAPLLVTVGLLKRIACGGRTTLDEHLVSSHHRLASRSAGLGVANLIKRRTWMLNGTTPCGTRLGREARMTVS